MSENRLNARDSWLWHQATQGHDVGTLMDAFGGTSNESVDQVTVATVIVESKNPLGAIRPKANMKFEVAFAGLVALMRVEDEAGPFVLGAWPTAHEGVFHLIGTIPTTDSRWRKVERWVDGAGPEVVPVFLDHDDFSDIGTALSEFGEVEVSRLAARKRSDHSSLNRGWKARSDSLRPSHHEAIAEAERNGASVRTLTLHVADVISLHLRRLAGATFYSGDFNLFQSHVLGRLASAAARRRALLSGRERRVSTEPPPPITVRLSAHLLRDAQATGELLEELEQQRNTAVAVLHRNPYFHAVVTDYSDGSNFDVFVTRADAIDVYPGFRASLGSLTRLTQRLGERFEAREIVEALPHEQVSLDDLLANG